jgi:hypothetical protein
MSVILGLSFLILIVCAYFAPGLIASRTQKKNAAAIFALNLLLGWTFIGWIVAFLWALSND